MIAKRFIKFERIPLLTRDHAERDNDQLDAGNSSVVELQLLGTQPDDSCAKAAAVAHYAYGLLLSSRGAVMASTVSHMAEYFATDLEILAGGRRMSALLALPRITEHSRQMAELVRVVR